MLIIALLLLIVAILLFGAGAVKGVLANTFAIGCGFVVIVGLLLWIASLLDVEFMTIVWVVGGLLMLFALWAAVDPQAQEIRREQERQRRAKMKR